MVTVALNQTGGYLIPNPQGTMAPYRIISQPLPDSWLVERCDTGDRYLTSLEKCTCPDWRYRPSPRGCKHQRALRSLLSLGEKSMNPDEEKTIQEALAAPFPANQVGWKPQTTSGNRALAVAYIDARNVMDRLDDVVGVLGWQDTYTFLPDGSAQCSLSVRIGSEWVTKSDVGGESDQNDEGDRHKAAVSDALKRAAVKFGVGRYLYRLPLQWVDYDPQKKRLLKTPSLPAWALPGGGTNGQAQNPAKVATPPHPAAAKPAGKQGEDSLLQRVLAFEHEMVKAKFCQAGDLQEHLRKTLGEEFGPDIADWEDIPGAVPRVEYTCRAYHEEMTADLFATPKQYEALEGQLKRTRTDWSEVVKRCHIESGTGPGEVTRGELRRAMEYLQPLPDAGPQKKPTQEAPRKPASRKR